MKLNRVSFLQMNIIYQFWTLLQAGPNIYIYIYTSVYIYIHVYDNMFYSMCVDIRLPNHGQLTTHHKCQAFFGESPL